MKKPSFSILVPTTVLFFGFLLGFYVGRNRNSGAVTVSVPAQMMTLPEPEITLGTEPEETEAPVQFPININTADAELFTALPGIGEVLAQRIVAYRDEHGPFVTVTDLMNVKDIGKKRMEEIIDLVTTGG